MSNKRRNRRTSKSARQTPMGRAKAQTKLAANLTEEHEWYLDTPDVRLSRIFTVVLLLHIVAFGGILAFKMVDKASANTAITISSARESFEKAVEESRALASEVPARTGEVAEAPAAAVPAPVEDRARPLPPSPLRRDRNAQNQYKVQTGDTLAEIAADLNVNAAALRKANSIISDNELYPGRWLNLPTESDVMAAESTAEVPATSSSTAVGRTEAAPTEATPKEYVVAKGDTAWAISRKLNVSFSDLMKLNGIDRPETLQIGQRLKIPGAR